MVAILDSPGDGYSSRAASAAYCVADESTDAFRRFHAALYAQQPEEGGRPFPDNAQLIEVARQAGVDRRCPDCINKGRYVEMVKGMAARRTSTPPRPSASTARTTHRTTPDALVAKVKEIVGDVPGLDGRRTGPPPSPTPPAPARRRAMTVAAPSAVQPTEPAADAATGAGPDCQRGMGADRRCRRARGGGHADGREDRNPDQPRLRAVVQPQPGAVVRFGDDHPAGVGVRLPQPADRHRRRSPSWWSPVCSRSPRSRCRAGTGSGLAAGTLLGTVFVHWLIFQSLYRIGALCPYCMVVWAVTIPLLVVVASIALQPPQANAVARVLYTVAVVAGGAVVHRADSADPRAVLGLLVHPSLNRSVIGG